MAQSDPNLQKFDIDELVIHGNATRAKQHGYTNPVVGIDPDVIPILQAAYPGIEYSQHFYGNPAFCMKLTLSDFFRSPEGQIGFTVEHAYLRRFPMSDRQQGMGWDYSQGAVAPPEANVGYNSASPYCKFNCPFHVNVALFSGSTKLNEITIIDKPDSGIGQWPERYAACQEPYKITGKWDVNSEERVILAVLMYSICSCNQGSITRPVFATDITAYIPQVDPYVWRRFGTLAQEKALAQEKGYELPEEMEKLCDQKWHLIRPFYYVDNVGRKRWENVEAADPTKE